MSILYSSLKNFDLFGQPIELCMNKKYYHTSTFGGFLTLILIILFSLISIQGFLDLIFHSEINSMTTTLSNMDPPFIQLNPTDFNWAIGLNPLIEIPGSKEYFKYEIIQSYNERDLQGITKKTKKIKYLEPCTLDHFKDVIKDSLKGITPNISLLLCPKRNESFNVEGKYTSLNFSFISIKIYKCMNSSLKAVCASQEEIDKAFKNNIRFNIYFLNNIININNLEESYSSFLDDRFSIILDKNNYKEKNFYFTSNNIFTDNGIFNTNYIKEYTTFTFENDFDEFVVDNSDFIHNNNTLYTSIFFRSNFISKDHKRTFTKVGKFIGYVGGFWSILFLFFGIIAKNYNKRRLIIKLSNSLYSFNRDKENDINKTRLKENIVNEGKKIYIGSIKKKNSDSFLSKIKDYISNNRGIVLIKDIKFALPNFLINLFSKEQTRKNVDLQKSLFKKAKMAILKDIDLLHILKKIKQIDKLIEILLNEDQKICFEFMPKSIISLNNNRHFEHSRSSLEYCKTMTLQKNEILKFKTKEYLKLYKSFWKIKKKMENDKIGSKIIENFDKILMSIFSEEYEKEQNDEIKKENFFKSYIVDKSNGDYFKKNQAE